MSIAAPIIHLNGSGAAALLRQFEEAHSSLYETLDKMRAARPHARDYYLQKDTVYDMAVNEHEARCKKVRDIIEEYAQLIEALEKQGVRR